MNIDLQTLDKIKNFLIQELNPYLIYLFGSANNGIFREDSDIDLAFLSTNKFSQYELFIIAQKLADILKREVDLINLNDSSTVFKAQVVGKGEKIYCLDENKRMNFEMYTFKEYALLNEEREIIMKNITKRGSVYGE